MKKYKQKKKKKKKKEKKKQKKKQKRKNNKKKKKKKKKKVSEERTKCRSVQSQILHQQETANINHTMLCVTSSISNSKCCRSRSCSSCSSCCCFRGSSG